MTTHLGRFFSLLLPIIIVLNVLIVLSRYVFGVGLVAFQELVLYLHAIIFLGCAGWVLLKDEHVRVDIFYRDQSNKKKNLVNFIGIVFFSITIGCCNWLVLYRFYSDFMVDWRKFY
jgi:TRAP-type mannitol/chloroaromatic compound transport system permease small subunit